MKGSILLFAILSIAPSAFAQYPESRGIIYNHEMSGGLSLHTSGWGIFLDVGRRNELKKKSIWQFEFTQLHHPKEIRQTIDFGLAYIGFNSPKPFAYGKQNNFYLVNASYGKQWMIAEKAEKSGVEVGFRFLGGISLGILKPYYLDVRYPTDQPDYYEVRSISYSPETAEKFLDLFSIYGGSGAFYGFDKIKFIPGIHLKSGLNFDWAQSDESIKELEVGVMFQAFYKEVPIMVLEENAQLYPNVYLSLQFGKKW